MATMTRLKFNIGPYDQSEHIIGPGSHVGFPISTKNTNLVYDHPMNISAKFGSNLFCGFRKKDVYKICVFGADRKSNMAARAHNVF
jgi:hypothetical protein